MSVPRSNRSIVCRFKIGVAKYSVIMYNFMRMSLASVGSGLFKLRSADCFGANEKT